MAKIGYRSDIFVAKYIERVVSERPVEFFGTEKSAMKRWTVAKEANAHLIDEVKILAPELIVPALFHFVDTTAVDSRRAVLDARRKHEGRCHKRLCGGLKMRLRRRFGRSPVESEDLGV